MSLTIYLKKAKKTSFDCECEHCGNKHQYETFECVYERNITHNVGKMADECGIYPFIWRHDENGIVTAKDLIDPINKSILNLGLDPEKYKKLEPKNGWGTYENLVDFLIELVNACQGSPDSTVHVWR